MDKLRMQSSNGVEDNIMKIAQLFLTALRRPWTKETVSPSTS